MNYPQIRIKDAWLLRQNVSAHLHTMWAKDGEELADDSDMKQVVARYKKAWEPYEKRVIHGMCEVLGLEFRQNTIDVYIAPWFYAFSDPMIVGVTYAPDRFVEVLAHEIIHRLLTDNVQTEHGTMYANEWKKLFGYDHTFKTIVHIPVHAVLQAIFDDVLHEPARTKNDRKLCRERPDYDAAWACVEKNGYRTIIKQLQQSYKELSNKNHVD